MQSRLHLADRIVEVKKARWATEACLIHRHSETAQSGFPADNCVFWQGVSIAGLGLGSEPSRPRRAANLLDRDDAYR